MVAVSPPLPSTSWNLRHSPEIDLLCSARVTHAAGTFWYQIFDAADLVKSEVRSAGFAMVSCDDHFIDPDEESTRWMIVFPKPPS